MAFRTQEQVDRLRLPAGKSDHWEFDSKCTGLSIRLQGKRRTWVCWYTPTDGGRRKKLTLGDVAAVRLQGARDRATEIVQASRKGEDVGAQRRAAREAARTKAADTLRKMIDAYLERRAKPRQKARSYAETERNLMKAWAPLHARPVDSITRKDVADQVERIRTTSGPSAAKNAHGYLNGAFVWAMKAGLANSNPVAMTEEPDTPPSKARALKPAELVAIWNACEYMGEFGIIVKLLMLTGQRRNEVAGMAWSEIDVDRRLWRIHSLRTKNGREHEVPLSDLALALLPERREKRGLVFGLRAGPFSGFSHAKTRLNKHIARANAERRLGRPLEKDEKTEREDAPQAWRPHDLRHSFVTHCAEIGVDPHIIESCVNHISGHKAGIAGVYNAAKYREQKRAAMTRFAQWIDQLVSGEEQTNVVKIA